LLQNGAVFSLSGEDSDMRAMLTATIGVTLCFTLFGCDQNPQQAQTGSATPVAIAPPTPCNCRPTVATPAAGSPRYRPYRLRYAHQSHYGHHRHTLSEFLPYSTESSSYGESDSSSVREYRPEDEMRYSESVYSRTHGGAQYQQGTSADAWVDGYGRAHYADYCPLEDENQVMLSIIF
jgi:hypothetical protein